MRRLRRVSFGGAAAAAVRLVVRDVEDDLGAARVHAPCDGRERAVERELDDETAHSPDWSAATGRTRHWAVERLAPTVTRISPP
jgi:hypothetical protein